MRTPTTFPALIPILLLCCSLALPPLAAAAPGESRSELRGLRASAVVASGEGDYTVGVVATGFRSVERAVTVATGEPVRIEVTLQLAGVHETVTVSERARVDLQGVPGGVALVSEGEIEDNRAHNLDDVLAFVPGVVAQPRFGADESRLSVRGSGLRNNFHHRGLNLLINGIPYQDADGFSDFESIDLMATESVQVWKGANALRHGGNSMGGAINFETHTGHTAPLLQAWVEGGSFELFLHAENLADENYAASVQVDNALGRFLEPANGRSATLGVRWKLRQGDAP